MCVAVYHEIFTYVAMCCFLFRNISVYARALGLGSLPLISLRSVLYCYCCYMYSLLPESQVGERYKSRNYRYRICLMWNFRKTKHYTYFLQSKPVLLSLLKRC